MNGVARGALWALVLMLSASPAQARAAGRQIVDLTHAFNARTIYWPASPAGFELKRLFFGRTGAGYFYAANALSAPEHGGTHLDAPVHFAERGQAVDEIPLERLVGAAVVIDVSKSASRNPDYRLARKDVLDFEKAHGRIGAGAIVLLRTGWSRFWPDRKAYLGDDTPGDASKLHFPSYGEEAARLLIEERGAAVLGVDTASIDYGPSKNFIVHQIAAAGNAVGLENLTELDKLPQRGALVIALPMKIEGGSGAPARVIAILGGNVVNPEKEE